MRARVIATLISPWKLIHRLIRPVRIASYLSTAGSPKLHIGCGRQALDGWLNTDLIPRIPEAIFLNCVKRFPFEDSSFDYAFSEHLIEHLSYEQGEAMLREVCRVLKPGASFRVATPDLDFLVALRDPELSELQQSYVSWALAYSNLPDTGVRRELAVINHFFKAWGHQFIYDRVLLRTLLERSGFVEVSEHAVGESDSPALRGLESHGSVIPKHFNRLETMVLEARKPPEDNTSSR